MPTPFRPPVGKPLCLGGFTFTHYRAHFLKLGLLYRPDRRATEVFYTTSVKGEKCTTSRKGAGWIKSFHHAWRKSDVRHENAYVRRRALTTVWEESDNTLQPLTALFLKYVPRAIQIKCSLAIVLTDTGHI